MYSIKSATLNHYEIASSPSPSLTESLRTFLPIDVSKESLEARESERDLRFRRLKAGDSMTRRSVAVSKAATAASSDRLPITDCRGGGGGRKG